MEVDGVRGAFACFHPGLVCPFKHAYHFLRVAFLTIPEAQKVT